MYKSYSEVSYYRSKIVNYRADAFSSFYAARMKDDSKDEIPGGRKTGKKKSTGKGIFSDNVCLEKLK